MCIIIEGYLALIHIHHDHVHAVLSPLYPWLHSSKACEHTFGEAQQVMKDFTMLDFLYLVPKLKVKMQHEIFKAKTSDAKSRASGYSHSYFDMVGLDWMSLAMFPSDEEISTIAETALEEADSLISLLGLIPIQVHSLQHTNVVLPGIESWLSHPPLDC